MIPLTNGIAGLLIACDPLPKSTQIVFGQAWATILRIEGSLERSFRPTGLPSIGRILIMGANGYVRHADASRTLVPAIFCIATNQLWVPPEVLHEFLQEVSCVLRKGAHFRGTTTRRENEILELLRRRLSNREIADLLKIRVSTVKFHMSNILSKLHANNRSLVTTAGT